MASNSKARFSQCEVYPTAEENLKSVIKHGRTVTRMLKKNLLDVGRRGFAHQGDGPSNTSRSTFKFYSFVILWYINISRANIEIWKGVEFSWRRRRQQQRSQQKRAPRKSRRFNEEATATSPPSSSAFRKVQLSDFRCPSLPSQCTNQCSEVTGSSPLRFGPDYNCWTHTPRRVANGKPRV